MTPYSCTHIETVGVKGLKQVGQNVKSVTSLFVSHLTSQYVARSRPLPRRCLQYRRTYV